MAETLFVSAFIRVIAELNCCAVFHALEAMLFVSGQTGTSRFEDLVLNKAAAPEKRVTALQFEMLSLFTMVRACQEKL